MLQGRCPGHLWRIRRACGIVICLVELSTCKYMFWCRYSSISYLPLITDRSGAPLAGRWWHDSTLRNADPHASPAFNSSVVGFSLRLVVQSTHPGGGFMEMPLTAPCSRSSFSTQHVMLAAVVTHRHVLCVVLCLVPNSLILILWLMVFWCSPCVGNCVQQELNYCTDFSFSILICPYNNTGIKVVLCI